jgi:serine/threonine protein kinase
VDNIAKKKAERISLLRAIYDKTDGRVSTLVDYSPLGEDLGLDRNRTLDMLRYLSSDGLVQLQPLRVSLTHQGIVAVEAAYEQQQRTFGLNPAALQLGERIGRGGFGEVYRYKHEFLQMDFAVKVFSPFYTEDKDTLLQRFFREARILFALNHPNVIRVFDVGILENQPFILMELFPGKTLNEKLQQNGRVSPEFARNVVTQIAAGLQHAHAANVLHRDLKPSNVMVLGDNAEEVRILDFGLGVFVEADIAKRLTKPGEGLVGGHYSAPELIAEPRLLEPHIDIYSVGAIWFTLLTGRPPAGSNIAEVLDSEVHLSPEEREALLRCLRDAPNRFASASELRDTLRSLTIPAPLEPPPADVGLAHAIKQLAETPGTETYNLFRRMEEAKRTITVTKTAERLRSKP